MAEENENGITLDEIMAKLENLATKTENEDISLLAEALLGILDVLKEMGESINTAINKLEGNDDSEDITHDIDKGGFYS